MGHSDSGGSDDRPRLRALKVTAHSVERWLRLPFPGRSAPAEAGVPLSYLSARENELAGDHTPAGQACVALRPRAL